MEYIIGMAVLGALFIIREVQHSRERQDLLNRIMAKDYSEYSYKPSRKKVGNLIKKGIEKNLKKDNEN